MGSDNSLNNFRLFVLFADNKISVWQKIIESEVKHKSYGVGKIQEVYEANNNIYINIKFTDLGEGDGVKRFSSIAFENGYFECVEFDNFNMDGFDEFRDIKTKEETECLIKEEIKAKKDKERKKMQEEQKRLFDFVRSGQSLFKESDDVGLINIGLELTNLLVKSTVIPKQTRNLCEFIVSAHLNQNDVMSAIEWINTLPRNIKGLESIKSRLHEIKEQQRDIKIDNISDTYLLNSLAKLHKNLKAYRKAKFIYLRSFNIDRSNIYALNGLGGVCREAGWYEDGIKYYDMASELTENEVPFIGLGGIYRDLNKLDQASKYYCKALDINYASDFAHKGLGAVLFDRGYYEEGMKHFELAGEYIDYLLSLSEKYEREGLVEKAIECLNIILTKDKFNFKAKKMLNNFTYNVSI